MLGATLSPIQYVIMTFKEHVTKPNYKICHIVLTYNSQTGFQECR